MRATRFSQLILLDLIILIIFIVQAVSRRLPTWVRSHVTSRAILGGRSDTGTGFLGVYQSPVSSHSTDCATFINQPLFSLDADSVIK
jgi:hypothetical protein